MYAKFFKRTIDIAISALAILILSPLFLIITIAIKISDPGPAFFTQQRIGIHKTRFKFWKFRTMKVNTPDLPTHLLEKPDQYISRIGSFLRKTSLDELPQLIHVFSGKMSIIGPRPALWSQDDLIAQRDKYGANDMRPGLTGLAQINGRDELPIEVKAKLDGEYSQNISFAMDIKCFFGTIKAVLKKDGVVEGGTGKLKIETEREKEVVLK